MSRRTYIPILPGQRPISAKINIQRIATSTPTPLLRRHTRLAEIPSACRRTTIDDLNNDRGIGIRRRGGAATIVAETRHSVADAAVVFWARGPLVSAVWGLTVDAEEGGLAEKLWGQYMVMSTGTHQSPMSMLPAQCPPEMSGLMSPAAAAKYRGFAIVEVSV